MNKQELATVKTLFNASKRLIVAFTDMKPEWREEKTVTGNYKVEIDFQVTNRALSFASFLHNTSILGIRIEGTIVTIS